MTTDTSMRVAGVMLWPPEGRGDRLWVLRIICCGIRGGQHVAEDAELAFDGGVTLANLAKGLRETADRLDGMEDKRKEDAK